MLTTRFLGFALFVPALLILSALLPALAPAAVLLFVGLIVILLVDRAAAGQPDQFIIERTHDSKLSLGAANLITISVESRAQRAITITVRDEVPLLFVGAETDNTTHTRLILPRTPTDITYYVRPVRRGDFEFGDINLRYASPAGLYLRQATIPAQRPVKVYPNLYEMRKYDLLVRRDQLAEMGLRNVRMRGEGSSFESLREYSQGDPYRSINWKATARRGKPISTDYEPERSQRVMVLLDVGRMMRSPIRVDDPDGVSWNMAKIDFVLNSVLLFSYVASIKGDQVGMLVFADQVVQYIAPGAGRNQFHKLLETMYALQSEPVEADYGRALAFLRTQSKKRSLVVLFTDLSGLRASEALTTHVPRLMPRHLPVVVTIRDPALDEEANQPLETSEAVYRKAVAEQLIDDRRILLDTLKRRGVLTLDVAAEHLTMSVVNQYLRLKARQYI
ncbi:MAG: DUF58 domain-containing protein [Chloroflexota bacterium]